MSLFRKNPKTGKTIYLHIGVPKTASSTIQSGLFKKRELLAQDGYLYPTAGLMGTNHKNLFFEITSIPDHHRKFKPELGGWQAVHDEILASPLDKVIISAEHFALFRKKEISYLKKFLPGQVKVVVYLRRQDQAIKSGWVQNAKRLVTDKSFEEVVKEEQSMLSRSVYHYPHLLKKWEDAFGKENLIIRIFERDKLSGHIFHDLLQACGIDSLEKYPAPKSANISPDYKTMGIILEIMNQLDFDRVSQDDRFEIGRLVEFYCRKLGWPEEAQKYNNVDESITQELMDHFEKSNRKVARKYLNADTLFEDPSGQSEVTPFSLNEMSNTELLDIFTYVLNNLLAEK